jgi:hypothetical protein
MELVLKQTPKTKQTLNKGVWGYDFKTKNKIA